MKSNLVPTFILENDALDVTHGHFEAVTLFVNIAGFSEVTTTLIEHGTDSAELMAEIMLRVFEPLVDAVYAQGGFITTFAGDAFTAIFPLSEEGAYQHALATAVAIQQHFITHAVHETPVGKFPFSVKQGMGAGNVEWGILHSAETSHFSAYYFCGSAIDSAAEAEHHAKPGTIILSTQVQANLAHFTQKHLPTDSANYVRLLNVEGELPTPQTLAPPEILFEQTHFVHSDVLVRQTHGEFRQVVSLFIHLHGIHTGEAFFHFMEPVFLLLEQYQGYLGHLDFGDKGATLLVFWGMPTSTENDVERALNFMHDLDPFLPKAFHKAGMTYEPMYAGLAGSARRGEYTAYGNGISNAARLMVNANWGDIWLSERIAQSAGQQFLTTKVGSMEFQGFSDPQPIYHLVGKRSSAKTSFFSGAMIGREAELAQLQKFIEPIFMHHFAGIQVVAGEAGIGKSRLIHEFLARVCPPKRPAAPRAFVCQTDLNIHTPLHPLRYWLRRYFNQSSLQSEAENKAQFEHRLADFRKANPLHSVIWQGKSFLGALVDLYWEDSPYAKLTPRGRYEWTFNTLKALLLAESQRAPVLLVLEDIQGLDRDSIAFIERLVDQIESYPIAILATARPMPGENHVLGQLRYQLLTLPRFTAPALAELGKDLLGHSLNAESLDFLEDRTQGNPFFAEQMLIYLRESERIELVNEVWQITGSRNDIPDDVRAILITHLDHLPSTVKAIVQMAAILGQEFDRRVLQAMLEDAPAIDETLHIAEEKGIWIPANPPYYRFKHSLLRDTVYQMQLRARRRELHHLAAQAFQNIYAHNPATLGEITYHYETAHTLGLFEVQTQVLEYLQKAGEQAAKNAQNDVALDYFNRALEIFLPKTNDDTRYTLLTARAEVNARQGNRHAQGQDLEALKLLADNGQHTRWQAEVALLRAKWANDTGDYATAMQAAQEAVIFAQRAENIADEASAQTLWALSLQQQGDYTAAQDHLQQGLILAQASEQSELEATILRLIGLMYTHQDDPTRAQKYLHQSLRLAQALELRENEAHTLYHLANIAQNEADNTLATQYYRQSLAIFHEMGNPEGEAMVRHHLKP